MQEGFYCIRVIPSKEEDTEYLEADSVPGGAVKQNYRGSSAMKGRGCSSLWLPPSAARMEGTQDWRELGGLIVGLPGFDGHWIPGLCFPPSSVGFVVMCSAASFYSCGPVDIPRHLLESWEDSDWLLCLVSELT